MDDNEDSTNGWLSVRYGNYYHNLNLRVSREDIDTLSARKADIQANNYALSYTGRYHNLWMTRLSAAHKVYTDDNTRNDFRQSVLVQLEISLAW